MHMQKLKSLNVKIFRGMLKYNSLGNTITVGF